MAEEFASLTARSGELANAAREAVAGAREQFVAGNLGAARNRAAEAIRLADDALQAANAVTLAAEKVSAADAASARQQAADGVSEATQIAQQAAAAMTAVNAAASTAENKAKDAGNDRSMADDAPLPDRDLRETQLENLSLPPSGPPRASSFLEYAGVNLAYVVILVIFVVLIGTGCVIYRWNTDPQYPVDQIAKYLSSKDDWLAYYDKQAAAVAEIRKETTELVKLILINILLPVLTAILGYVFGTQHQKAKEEAAEDDNS